jgi:hypothetical protein
MKKRFNLSVLIFCCVFTAHAQITVKVGNTYAFKTAAIIYEYNDNNWVKADFQVLTYQRSAPKGGKFEVISHKDGFYVIRFLPWTLTGYKTSSYAFVNKQAIKAAEYNYKTFNYNAATSSATLGINTTNYASNTNILYFAVLDSDMENSSYDPEDAKIFFFSGGTVIMPFKLRPQKGEFTKDLSLSGVGNFGWRLTKNSSISALAGAGVGIVTLDSANTEAVVLKSTDRGAITLNIGVIYQFKQMQIGVTSGLDFLSGRKDNWYYNGKPWLSFGIGVSIFKPDGDTNVPKSEGQK